MEEFKAFKKNVPVMGGILLDQDMQRVLLVKGWKNTACWGFPRGKIHKNETDAQCAVREVRSERLRTTIKAWKASAAAARCSGGCKPTRVLKQRMLCTAQSRSSRSRAALVFCACMTRPCGSCPAFIGMGTNVLAATPDSVAWRRPQVLEETGYDIEDLVNDDDFIELTLDGKRNKLFIVAGLDPNSAQFAPKCKGVSVGLHMHASDCIHHGGEWAGVLQHCAFRGWGCFSQR